MPGSVRAARLASLFLAALLAFNYPLLAVFNGVGSVFGIPVLYAYLFAAWIAVIALAALLVRRLA